ncbi:MAG: hypothetical protein AAF961_04700, partial [Planctomycetota bacterium]
SSAVDQAETALEPAVDAVVKTRVEVNLAELTARIAGYHDGLNELSARIIANGDAATARELSDWILDAEQLAEQLRFVRLYHDALADEEKTFVSAPRSMSRTVEQLQSVVALAQQRDGDYLLQFDDQRAPLYDKLEDRLEIVSDQLAAKSADGAN